MERWLDRFANAFHERSADLQHDLKTPLNIAVLNLELLRMRVAKLVAADDEKLAEYSRCVELELRRLAQIFDAFFTYATPPKGALAPSLVDIAPAMSELAEQASVKIGIPIVEAGVMAHEARIRELLQFFVFGARKIFSPGSAVLTSERRESALTVRISGAPSTPQLEVGKLLKFYYTDASGAPELSLATARLIAETYGGTVSVSVAGERVRLELVLPLGER